MTSTRIPFQVKLSPENHEKVKQESKKIGLTGGGFINMLISTYKSTDITRNAK